MSRGTAARRRRDDSEGWTRLYRVTSELDDAAWKLDELREKGERLDAENAQLREQVTELDGWYRLLQATTQRLQSDAAEAACAAAVLEREVDRLTVENQELHALASRNEASGMQIEPKENAFMTRIFAFVRSAQRYKWATAAVLAIATLLARDPAVQGALGSAAQRVRQAFQHDDTSGRAAADSGFLRYAAMVNSRDQAEQARRDYNENETRLKGDALLEAQDRLRAAKARYLQARLAFLPELARRCEQAGVSLPKDAAGALAELKQESVK